MDMETIKTTATRLTLRDKLSGGQIFLITRDGVVTGAMGCEPDRYLGKSIDRARQIARYGGR
jgi:hypothetical protein